MNPVLKYCIGYSIFILLFLFNPLSVKTMHADLGFDADAPTTTVTVTCWDSSDTQVGTDQVLSSTTTTANCGSTSVKATLSIGCADNGGGNCTSTSFSVNGTPESTTGPWPYSSPSELLNTGGSPSGTHTISNINSTDDHTNTEASFTVTVVIGYQIQGTIYRDYAHDCSSFNAYTDTTPTISITPTGTASITSGVYTISGLTPGTYNITLTAPSGYAIFSSGSCTESSPGVGGPTNAGKSITISSSSVTTGADFYITPLYQILGSVFTDLDKNGLKGTGENPYSSSVEIATAGGTIRFSTGDYNITRLTSGSYTVEYENMPSGYEATFPAPQSHSVTLGLPGCTVAAGHDASCDASGNVINLNFGITNSMAWWQCVGGDCRRDEANAADKIPENPTCGSVTGAYASIPKSPTSNSPGIVYFGSGTYDFGQGQANEYNWTGGASSLPFSPIPNIVRTSYSYIFAALAQNGINPTDLVLPTDYCGGGAIDNCTLSASLPNGIYKVEGNLKLIGTGSPSNYTFSGNKNYVFLIHGDLYLNSKILVDIGSTATFYVSGNIYVDTLVGQSSPFITACNPTGVRSTSGCDIEGFYSADGSFYTNAENYAGKTDLCTGTPNNKRLNIAGSIVANAGRSGGSIVNGRDLCGANLSCPAYTVTERPDFYLNAPNFIKAKNSLWVEEAP